MIDSKGVSNAAPGGGIVRRDHWIASSDVPGLSLYLREIHAPEAKGVLARKVILFIHGATIAADIYDTGVPGFSWMVDFAQRGARCFALDVRGYARSTRPACFDEEPEISPPYATARDVQADIDDAVEFVRYLTGAKKIVLVGGSWGSITSGMYAAGGGREKIDRVVLYAPIYADINQPWLNMIADPADPSRPNPNLGAYRLVTGAQIKERWDAEIPVRPIERWRPKAVIDAIVKAGLAADAVGKKRAEPAFRVPNGTLLDLFETFSRRPVYDASALTMPCLLVRGDSDPTSTLADMAGLHERLGSREKWQITIGGGSHFMTCETGATKVFDAAASFLADC